jgi:glycerophosphoryl diester phosphodiesterase
MPLAVTLYYICKMKEVNPRSGVMKWFLRGTGVLLLGTGLAFAGYSWYLHQKIKALTPAQKKVVVIGHAGLGFLSPLNPFNPYPANSLTSLTKALRAGADGLEIDIHLSQDGIPILFHDPRLEPMTPARGLIEEKPAASVVGLPYQGGFFYDLFHEEKVVTVETLLQKLALYPHQPDLHLDLRQEGADRSAYFAHTLVALLRRYHYPISKLTFISPKVELLRAFKKAEPRAGYLLDDAGDFETVLGLALTHQLDGVVLNARIMDAQRMQRLRRHGLKVVLFGPKAPLSIYKALLLEPDALEVNNVPALVEMVRDN